MKRFALGLLVCLVGFALVGLALAWSQPDLLRSWTSGGGPAPATEDSGLYCKEHGVPERFCTLCHEELKTTLMLCKEHGDIPEDICTLCHPEVEEKHKIEMCPKGHGLPRYFCFECGMKPSASLAEPDDGWCATHNAPEPLCADCAEDPGRAGLAGEGSPTRACRLSLPVVRLASARLARRIGLRTAPAIEDRHAHHVRANAETAYDANRFAEVTPRVSGFLREVRVDLGRAVYAGDVLAVVDSPEVGAAKTRHLSAQATLRLARANHDRIMALTKSDTVAAKQGLEAQNALNQAEAAAMDAEQHLRNLGFGDAELARILQVRDTKGTLEVVAPVDGTIVQRHAVQGEAVQPTTGLFAVADTARMWLWVDVYERDIAAVAHGQAVSFTISGTEAPAGSGRVSWVGTEVNPTTRTTRVRAELANPDGRLRANQFGRAEIQVAPEHSAVMIPRAALQRKDESDLVFLPMEGDRYRPQRVLIRPGGRGEVVEVSWGLKPRQEVVTDGAFLLKTEIMKGAIGAGCCE